MEQAKQHPDDARALDFFVKYLRCRTCQPNAAEEYAKAIRLLLKYQPPLDARCVVIDPSDPHSAPTEVAGDCEEMKMGEDPVLLMTIEGTDPSLNALVLNSHLDVVPAENDKWTVDPWAAVTKEGKIYGRGTQDMKSVGIQYLEALARLRAKGWKPKRTVHLLYVPDEESGGGKGMAKFTVHDQFKSIKWGFVLDEGLACPDDKYKVFWGERKPWWLRVRTTGPAGHGSRFIEGTAVEKLMKICNSFLAFREEEIIRYKKGCACGKTLGDFTTVNLTAMRTGVEDENGRPLIAYNVIPTVAEAGFDIRISASVPLEDFKKRVEEWCSEEGATWELVSNSGQGALKHATTEPSEHEYWCKEFDKAMTSLDVKFESALFPAATDSRYLRLLGIPCFGFSPIKNTPVLLHDHDEHIPVDVFLEGIQVYEKLLRKLADVAPAPDEQQFPGCVPSGRSLGLWIVAVACEAEGVVSTEIQWPYEVACIAIDKGAWPCLFPVDNLRTSDFPPNIAAQ